MARMLYCAIPYSSLVYYVSIDRCGLYTIYVLIEGQITTDSR